jgi:hypothetical protein
MKNTAAKPVADGRIHPLKEQGIAVAENVFQHHQYKDTDPNPPKPLPGRNSLEQRCHPTNDTRIGRSHLILYERNQ